MADTWFINYAARFWIISCISLYSFNMDPLFVRDPDAGPDAGPDGNWDGVGDDYGDLRLRPDSPCIDAGDPPITALLTSRPISTDRSGY